MNRFVDFSELDQHLLNQYRETFVEAFPDVIFNSEIVKHCWKKVENYFPEFQRILVAPNEDLIGFINTIPLYYEGLLKELPDNGWDWLMQKGIEDFEKGLMPNFLGGLQVVVSKDYLSQGYSKQLISEGKRIMQSFEFSNFIIPIRPTLKMNYPSMNMHDYISFKKKDKIYDPWIRTHLNSGAKIIKVCPKSMQIKGPLDFWEDLMHSKIKESGNYHVKGALNLVSIDVQQNIGEYLEENIWINYN